MFSRTSSFIFLCSRSIAVISLLSLSLTLLLLLAHSRSLVHIPSLSLLHSRSRFYSFTFAHMFSLAFSLSWCHSFNFGRLSFLSIKLYDLMSHMNLVMDKRPYKKSEMTFLTCKFTNSNFASQYLCCKARKWKMKILLLCNSNLSIKPHSELNQFSGYWDLTEI